LKCTAMIKNRLFALLKNKTLVFEFEQQLRRGALDYGIDVAQLRNKYGCTLLHCAVIEDRIDIIYCIFRVGCWNTIRSLTVKTGKHCEFEGKTADEIASAMRLDRLNKELDKLTEWEKSLNMIHVSARIGCLKDVKQWLEYSSDLHTQLDLMQRSTLYWACIGGNLDIVEILLNLKVDFAQVDSKKKTLLHAACGMGHSHLFETLMTRCNQDPTSEDIYKWTPLHFVSFKGDVKSLEELLKYGMKKEMIGSVLAKAGEFGHLNFLRTAIEKYDIEPQSKDKFGKSALICASQKGNLEVLRYLFTKNLNFGEIDLERRNVLHVAASGATKEVMVFLINELKLKGVNVKELLDARDKYVGAELCFLVQGKDRGRAAWHYVEVNRRLLSIFQKKTGEHMKVDVARYGTILNSGWGIYPDESDSLKNDEVFEERRNNTSVNDVDMTPLHIAIFGDKTDVAEVLLENGADINLRDKLGLTPLHVAAIRGNIVMIRRLIENGASTQALDFTQKSPAEVAEDNEHQDAVNLLKSDKEKGNVM